MIFLQNHWLVDVLGWTLLHSVWQIAVVALALYLSLRLLKSTNSNARYLAACLSLCLCAGLPFLTFVRFAGEISTVSGSSSISTKNKSETFNEAFPRSEPSDMLEANGSANGFGEKNTGESGILQLNFSWLEKRVAATLPLMVWFWFFGVAASAWRLQNGLRSLRLLREKDSAPVLGEWRDRFDKLCTELKIRQTVRFIESSIVSTPLTIGWLKPIVFVPSSAFFNLSPGELEAILKHELIHIRRYDYPVNIIQSAIEILFFYHPAARWISATIRREREFACDDMVVKLSDDKLVYARALAGLEENRLPMKINRSPMAMAATAGKLAQRIKRIVEPGNDLRTSRFFARALCPAVMLSFGVLTVVFTTSIKSSESSAERAKTKKMAVGFVSLAPPDRLTDTRQDSANTTRLLIEKLNAHRLPAIGFVSGATVSDGEKILPVRADILRLWRDAGLEIGIGNFNHVRFYETPYEEYEKGVEKNERIVKQILAEKNLPLKYFSYPFLNTGKTTEDKNRFENWLKNRGLRSVQYTFDNQEWMYSFAYDMARKDNNVNTMKEIRSEFLDYMMKMLTHFESYSTDMFGRDIAQTLVLTPSRLVADTSDELFGMFERQGYKFVSMDEALADEAYRTEENFSGKAGISWFERWALKHNKPLKPEPEVSVTVEKIWTEAKAQK